ncbi:MAG: amidohydrolase family protein, partial [Actinomycetota bacterium]
MQAIRGELTWVGGRFQRDLAIILESDRIVEVVASPDLPEGTAVDDWGPVAIVPGTVNCHGHAFQNLFKGFADDRPFDEWRDRVLYPFSDDLGGEAIYVGALFAFAEGLLAGTTTTVDFFYLHDADNYNARQVIRAAHDIGIRLVLARAFYDSDAPTSAPKRYRERAEESALLLRELAAETSDDVLVSVQPAPHSLHAASPATIRVALEAADDLEVPCHLHLAEARYEVDQVKERYGTTPVRLLHREGLLHERLVAVHGVWLDDEELDLLAQAGSAVVHCPGANAFLG